MNCFTTDLSPAISAFNLCDQHRNKMISESTQLLCNAYWHSGEAEYYRDRGINLYLFGYPKHPCTKWVYQDLHNFNWLVEHLKELINLYRTFGGKKYLRESTLLEFFLSNPPKLPNSLLHPPYLAFGTDISKELNAAYKGIQKHYGVWNEELGVFAVSSWSIGINAYRHYINLKEFKSKEKRNPITGEITEIIRQYPTFKKRKSSPEWYKHIDYKELNYD